MRVPIRATENLRDGQRRLVWLTRYVSCMPLSADIGADVAGLLATAVAGIGGAGGAGRGRQGAGRGGGVRDRPTTPRPRRAGPGGEPRLPTAGGRARAGRG